MNINYMNMLEFYKKKKILLTGHTGFKGTWLTRILLNAGADVCGYALEPPTTPNLFGISGLTDIMEENSVIGDIRDLDHLKSIFASFHPDIVFHLAAQPIVRDSYRDPVGTYSTNVMGTVNILECIRLSEPGRELNDGTWDGVKSFLNVTTDKVYKNNEWEYGYRENDPLDGLDPYSNSKSCSELVTHAYRDSFFSGTDSVERISTARAGNVIGGGDFANDRIIPDCVRAVRHAYQNKADTAEIIVRNPYSIRPYQHVLEPLFAYLMIAKAQYEDSSYAGYYNVGPDDCDCVTTGELVDLFCEKWNGSLSAECSTNAQKDGMQEFSNGFPFAGWRSIMEDGAPHEANFLKLDTSKFKTTFGWRPRWHMEQTMEQTVRFTKVWLQCIEKGSYAEILDEMDREITEYM